MGNLMKYEIRSNYKLHLSLYFLMALVSLVTLTRIDKWQDATVLMVIGLICVAASVLVLATTINSLNKELKNNSKYLTYTLPVSTSSIVISKMLVGLMWINIMAVVIITIIYLSVSIVYGTFGIPNLFSLNTISSYIFAMAVLIQLFGVIFFAVVVSRLAPKLQTLIGILVFVGTNIIKEFITTALVKYIPGVLNIGIKNLVSEGDITFEYMDIITLNSITNTLQIHVPGMMFEILFNIALIYGAIYLLDKKVDI